MTTIKSNTSETLDPSLRCVRRGIKDALLKWYEQNNQDTSDLPGVGELLFIYGDLYTRLHGVYSGYDMGFPETDWFGPTNLL